jgi:hypothetical protein
MADHATTEDIESKLKEKLSASHLVRLQDLPRIAHTNPQGSDRPQISYPRLSSGQTAPLLNEAIVSLLLN